MYRHYLTAMLALRAPEDEAGSGGGGAPAPAPAPQPDPTPAGSGDTGKTFTQAQLDEMFEERLARDRKAREAEAKTKAEREKMDAEARAKAEKDEAEQRAQAAEQRALNAERRADLAGKVIDPAAAIKLLDPDKHLDKDGNVKVEALLKDYPYLAPTQRGASAPGAGGAHPANSGNPLDSWASADAADRNRR